MPRPLHPRDAARINAVFADTTYYLGLLNENDELHAQAVDATREIRSSVVTTAWVLTEVADAMCRVRNRALAASFIRDLKRDSRVTVISASAELFDRGFDLYCARPDKEWSLTDCISIIVMQDRGLTEALTADHHFEQAGFSIFLR